MNPLKWIARRVLGAEMSDLRETVRRQEQAIGRLMVSSDGGDLGRALAENKRQGEILRLMSDRIHAALDIHDQTKAPNSTVKRMARALRGEE